MLTLKEAWTNEATGGPGFALWFAAVDPEGQWWWIITTVSRAFGFSYADLRKVGGRDDIVHEMTTDEGEGDWTSVHPSEALDWARSEFERVHLAPWTLVYTDHFREICDQYTRFREAVDGTRAPEQYP